ncbi:MAG TPA: tetratricopeptide repeat protein, partial [Alphaproteobacteria bacterium]|nr:tetratricopeptide repeat protein [Alphaproteobacteria bacterium]
MQEENGSGTGSTPAPAAAADGTRRAAPNDKAAPRHRAEGDARAISSLWRRGKRWGKGAFSVTTALSTLLLAGWIVWLVGEATLRSRGLNLHLIAVPEKLAKDGVTTEVLTWRMRDAIMAVQDLGATTMAKTNVQVRQNMTDITIPMAGVSVESVVASIRHLLPASWRHEAYGEFTLTGTRLSLRLRLNGPIVFSDAATYPDALDTLIEKAAFKLVEETQPYVAASARFEKGDLDGAAAAADQIIASFPPEDESFMRAYNLKGLVAQQQGDVRKAAAFYMMAPNLAVARLNLGVLLDKSGNVEEAAAEYGKAILLDPKYAPPHNNLGRLWWKQKKPDRAIAEFLTAIRLDPKYALPHYNLGVLWDEQNEPDNAVAEYRAAIRLDPKDAPPHN